MKSLPVVLVSGACCNPALRGTEQQMKKKLEEALTQLGIAGGVKELPASAALFGGVPPKLLEEIKPLVGQFGMAAFPLVFVQGKVLFYGGTVPPLDEITSKLAAFLEEE